MPFSDTPVTGPGLAISELWTNVDDFRTWLNSVPDGDVADNSILREHVVRPQVLGFPVNGFLGALQRAYLQEIGIGGPDLIDHSEWGPILERVAIVPRVTNGVEERFVTCIGRTFDLESNSDVRAMLTMAWAVAAADTATGPDGVGGGEQGGHFAFYLRDRSDGSLTKFSPSTNHVYPFDTGQYGDRHDWGILAYVESHPAGTYDLVLVYHRDLAPDEVHQIDITRAQLSMEVF